MLRIVIVTVEFNSPLQRHVHLVDFYSYKHSSPIAFETISPTKFPTSFRPLLVTCQHYWPNISLSLVFYLYFVSHQLPILTLHSVRWFAESELVGETEVFGETSPPSHIVHHISRMTWPGDEPGLRDEKPAANHISYSTASDIQLNNEDKGEWYGFLHFCAPRPGDE
jgi:hypothetical protein